MWPTNIEVSIPDDKVDEFVAALKTAQPHDKVEVQDHRYGPGMTRLCYRNVASPIDFALQAMSLGASSCGPWHNMPAEPA